MRLLHSLPPYNFCGLEPEQADFRKAKVVVIPVPYDSTASYSAGAREGPHALIAASRFMELYDSEIGRNVSQEGIFTTDELAPARGSPEETIKRIKTAVGQVLENNKFPLVLGGEHSITIGVVQAFAEGGKDFSVLRFDAHADLWDDFEGSFLSHACTGARIAEMGINEVAVGIRSVGEKELDFAKEKKMNELIFAKDFGEDEENNIDSLAAIRILPKLKERVYVSIDLDAFDPSVIPGTGTPEPGGLDWKQVTGLLAKVAEKKKIVGADVCELSPIPGNHVSEFTAARLAYRVLGLALA